LCLCLSTIAGDVAKTESLQNWRDRFRLSDQSLQNGQPIDYSDLADYPLYPYLRYRDLSRRLPEFPLSEVRDFLQNYSNSPVAGKLRQAWLRELAKARRWDEYLKDVPNTRDPSLECWRRQALLNTGRTEQALQDFAAVWLQGRALPSACDSIIVAWRHQGGLAPPLLWQRFALAMSNRNLSLARVLRTEIPITDQPLADTWLAISDNPAAILEDARFRRDDPRTAEIIGDGLKLWGKRDALAATVALDTLKQRYPRLAPQWLETERLLAVWLATDYHPSALARLAALPDSRVDGTVREWRVRICLRQGDWVAALRWLDQLTRAEQESSRWQYWRGRSLELLGRADEALPIYRRIANRRDYHGFLAAERLGAAYSIVSHPVEVPPTELEKLLATAPGLQRARELYILDREPEAEAEWQLATQNLDRATLQHAAVLAHGWDWHSQAIATLARADSWDDLDLRFPLAYRDSIVSNALSSTLDPAWVYAVIRQESTFRATAHSPVGALGLMQLMPATAQELARQAGDSVDKIPEGLLQADANLRLGSRYLQKLLQRLQNNPVLATAAYNAGPNKVMQWLPTQTTLAADIWAETIPYQETRSYVQRVLEYATIYTYRLGTTQPNLPRGLGLRMKPIQPTGPNPDAG
jgi:soluble lytic murein transglycosylase